MAKKKKEKRVVPHGRIYIHSTFNNTIVTVTDAKGNPICWASGGTVGLSGTKKGTPYAAQLAAHSAIEKAKNEYQLQSAEVYVKGPGVGRDSALRTVANSGIQIKLIKDITPIPHNGCRPRKKRRV